MICECIYFLYSIVVLSIVVDLGLLFLFVDELRQYLHEDELFYLLACTCSIFVFDLSKYIAVVLARLL